MGFLDRIMDLFTTADTPRKPVPPPAPEPDPDEIKVPEITPLELRTALEGSKPPFVLDVREQYEWSQVHMTDAKHIPMGSVPVRLNELPRDRTIVVMCAHGSRSFGVTHYLLEQGFDAQNLTGGITRWHQRGGEVVVRTRQ